MKPIAVFAALLSFLAPLASFAHGGGHHFRGTVTAVDEKGLTLETGDKKEVKVVFDEKTRFEKGDAAAAAKDIAIGDRVVVHTMKGDDARAALVKIGKAKKEDAHGGEHHEASPGQ